MTTEFNTNSKAIIIGLTDTGEKIPAASYRLPFRKQYAGKLCLILHENGTNSLYGWKNS